MIPWCAILPRGHPQAVLRRRVRIRPPPLPCVDLPNTAVSGQPGYLERTPPVTPQLPRDLLHDGFDWKQIRNAVSDREANVRQRGASTISQQV